MINLNIKEAYDRVKKGCDLDTPEERDGFIDRFFETVETKEGVIYRAKYTGFADFIWSRLRPVLFNNTLYVYADGLYREDKGDVRGLAMEMLRLFAGASLAPEWAVVLPETTKLSSAADEIYKQAAAMEVIGGDESPFDRHPGIPFANGVLHRNADGVWQLEKYSPEMRFTRRFAVGWNPDADTGPVRALFASWAGEKNVDYLIQIFAQVMIQALPDMQPCKKAYMLNGERNSGKTTFLKLAEAFFSEGNVSHLELQILDERFNTAALVGKFMNTGDDLQSIKLKDCGVFKSLTGSKSHTVEPKGKPRFNARITACFVFTCNRPPALSKSVSIDDAFWDRWIYLVFGNSFAKQAGWFQKTVTPEFLEGLGVLAVEFAGKILDRGGELLFTQDLDETRCLWENEASPELEFLAQFTQGDAKGFIAKDELFEALHAHYKDDADALARIPASKMALSQAMTRAGYSVSESGKGKNRVMCYRGLSWKPDAPWAKKETVNGSLV